MIGPWLAVAGLVVLALVAGLVAVAHVLEGYRRVALTAAAVALQASSGACFLVGVLIAGAAP